MDLAVVLSGLGLALYAMSFLICITMITLIVHRIRPLRANVAIFLVCNTYLCCFLVSAMMLLMYSYTLRGNLDPSAFFGGHWCRMRTYLANVSFGSLYYSFVLQAVFRLFRIVFYRHKFLQSFGACIIGIAMQWILTFLFVLPNLLFDDFQYLAFEYNCWIAFQNIRGLLIAMAVLFNNPLSIIFTIYTQIIRYTRRTAHRNRGRKTANQRDLAVLKRILILVLIIVVIGLPTVVVILIYMISNQVIPYAYHIQGLSIALGVLMASVSLVFVTPQIQQMFTQTQTQIHPHQTMTRTVN